METNPVAVSGMSLQSDPLHPLLIRHFRLIIKSTLLISDPCSSQNLRVLLRRIKRV